MDLHGGRYAHYRGLANTDCLPRFQLYPGRGTIRQGCRLVRPILGLATLVASFYIALRNRLETLRTSPPATIPDDLYTNARFDVILPRQKPVASIPAQKF